MNIISADNSNRYRLYFSRPHIDFVLVDNLSHQEIMKIIVLVLVSVLSATAQDQCADNLVQALQTCASSIKAGESLAMQQAKCSPNGCNYDRPAVDLINGLRADTWNMFEATNNTIAQIKQMLIDQQQQISTNMDSIKIMSGNIATLSNSSLTQSDNIATLQDKVAPLGYPCGSPGWTRVAFLDMSDTTQECPSEFRSYDTDGRRACGRKVNNGASCDGITFPVDINYSEVCGRVYAFQYASPDGINPANHPDHNNIEGPYLDGVSITQGSPRQHIWSFIGSVFEVVSWSNTCPCNTGSGVQVQSFIGDDYFCESGYSGPTNGWGLVFYSDDVLWDGKGCRSNEEPCCDVPGIPWFRKVFDSETSDDIELRICGEEGTANEDTPVVFYEIYVK